MLMLIQLRVPIWELKEMTGPTGFLKPRLPRIGGEVRKMADKTEEVYRQQS